MSHKKVANSPFFYVALKMWNITYACRVFQLNIHVKDTRPALCSKQSLHRGAIPVHAQRVWNFPTQNKRRDRILTHNAQHRNTEKITPVKARIIWSTGRRLVNILRSKFERFCTGDWTCHFFKSQIDLPLFCGPDDSPLFYDSPCILIYMYNFLRWGMEYLLW